MCPCDASSITNDGLRLVDAIDEALEGAVSVDIVSSFVMESGVGLMEKRLKDASAHGVRIRLLTGRYLGITSPFAVRRLKEVPGIDIRFYGERDVSFHPKAYIFHYADDADDQLFIGSSNLSLSAFTDGVEWNYRLKRSSDPHAFGMFQSEFNLLFEQRSDIVSDEVLLDYEKSWVRPKADISQSVPDSPLEPRGPQIDALLQLQRTRDDGMDKALVVAATGVGKTVIAALDSKNFGRILYVAHQQGILERSAATFRAVHPDLTVGRLYDGYREDDHGMVFATVQTLSRSEVLGSIPPDRFDYIVIDEFHHAAAAGYRKVIDHFRPKFMIGLTATPERMDNRDVFVLMDYNVPYEIGLGDSIRFGCLVPFRYYGVYDEHVRYDEIAYSNGKYDEAQLDAALTNADRSAAVLRYYRKYPTERALAFCSSIRHADEMCRYFNDRGISSAAVTSDPDSSEMNAAIDGLKDGDIKVIFTVDMFNEGIDIPAVDMVMFLRPTQSQTVFVQQLGRGLRLSDEKKYLTVLDFIGNYRKVDMIPSLLTGRRGESCDPRAIARDAPYGCTIDFDLRSVDVLAEMHRRSLRLADRADEEYRRIAADLGRRPTRVELMTGMDQEVYDSIRNRSVSPFRDYLGFLERQDALTPIERSFMSNAAGELIRYVENTGMSRLYKMPVLLAFCRGNDIGMSISDNDMAASFREFYSRDNNAVDIERQKIRGRKAVSDMNDEEWIRLARDNPVHFMTVHDPELFSADDDGMHLTERLRPYVGLKDFKDNIIDAIELRTIVFKQERYYKEAKE